jgi:ubiquinone/menaquinone biosynthesis C-methylase UbiE
MSHLTDATDVFSTKAARYARYRWDYAPQAIRALYGVTGISRASAVADVGAGTGILTRHFVDRVGRVYAVEPNAEMRGLAAQALGSHPACQIVKGRAEATTLPAGSVDLIAVAQAIGWFDPDPTRAEFLRILRPGGWLALLRNYGTDDAVGRAVDEVFRAVGAPDLSVLKTPRPTSFWYGGDIHATHTYAFTTRHTRASFVGAVCTTSNAPDETSPAYARFVRGIAEVFERFSAGGVLEGGAVTELCLGRMAGT